MGCGYITVDAYNQPEIVMFYKKNNFRILKIKENEEPGTILMYRDLLEI
jgi:hypothetical protein